MDSTKLKVLFIVVLTAFSAVYLGIAAATAQTEVLLWTSGIILVSGCLALGRYVWTLIPVMGVMSGFVNAVPGSPSAWYLGVAMAGILLAMRFAMRARDLAWQWGWMDTLILLQVAVLAQAYLRNRTGFALFGGDIVGGKPYVEYTIAIAGFFVMSLVRTDFQTARKVILVMIMLQLGDSIIKAASGFYPGFALAVGRVYSNVDYTAAFSALQGEGRDITLDTRFGSLRDFALTLGLICYCFYRPLTCLIPLHPKRFILFSISIAAMLLSGFRSGLINLGFMFAAASVARRKPVDVIAAGLFGLMVLSLIVASGQVQNMPFAAQRVISFLPVEVDPRARAEAEGSKEWRFEMWRLALFTDRYIHNKFLGDGFGFSAAEQKAYDNIQAGIGYASKEQSMDYMIAKGSYHGFHVETVRFTGGLGLIVATIILVFFAVKAWRLIRYYEKSPYWGYVMYICLPFVVSPIYYWLIFGSYKSGFVTYILAAGMLKMLDNIRLRELAEARQAMPVTKAVAHPERTVPPSRFPQPALRTR